MALIGHITGEAEPIAHMLRAGGRGAHGFGHPTRSRQLVRIRPYRNHPAPIPLGFKDSLLGGHMKVLLRITIRIFQMGIA